MVTHSPSLGSDIPRHVAIIMDGNGRWAKDRDLPRHEGHRAGADSVEIALETCIEIGVSYLTLYAFSSENWNRPAEEIQTLMGLLDFFLHHKRSVLIEKKIRFQAIGQLYRLPASTQKLIQELVHDTRAFDRCTLVLALSYGSREEITHAARALVQAACDGKLRPEEVTNERFAAELHTADIPDPDLLIRTSGEMRLSNFLLWQISYAEFVILKKNWPDFRREEFIEAIIEYQRRHRRFGAL